MEGFSNESEQKFIAFVRPDLASETGEIKRVAVEFANEEPEDFFYRFMWEAEKRSWVDFLNEEDWSRLENTDSFSIKKGGWKDVEKWSVEAKPEAPRDWERLRDRMKRGEEVDAPIVCKISGRLHLVSGNTRLMVAKALGLEPSVLMVDMDKTLPNKEVVEKLGLGLEEIFKQIKNLSREELLDAPREFILNGRIDVKILREIRKLGVEFSIAGEKGRLVFATGSIGQVRPNPSWLEQELYSFSFQDRKEIERSVKRVIKRCMDAKYSMHSHDNETSGLGGNIPSYADLDALQRFKNNTSLIFTGKGVLSYSCGREVEFNLHSELNNFLGLKYSKKYPDLFGESSEHNKYHFFNTDCWKPRSKKEIIEIQDEIFEDFCRTFNIIVSEATWENENNCQTIVDNYFKQNQ